VFTTTPTTRGPVRIAGLSDTCSNLIQLFQPLVRQSAERADAHAKLPESGAPAPSMPPASDARCHDPGHAHQDAFLRWASLGWMSSGERSLYSCPMHRVLTAILATALAVLAAPALGDTDCAPPPECGVKDGLVRADDGPFGRIHFRAACMAHGTCYAVLGTQAACDDAFLTDMERQCADDFPGRVAGGDARAAYRECMALADTMYRAAPSAGRQAYRDAQVCTERAQIEALRSDAADAAAQRAELVKRAVEEAESSLGSMKRVPAGELDRELSSIAGILGWLDALAQAAPASSTWPVGDLRQIEDRLEPLRGRLGRVKANLPRVAEHRQKLGLPAAQAKADEIGRQIMLLAGHVGASVANVNLQDLPTARRSIEAGTTQLGRLKEKVSGLAEQVHLAWIAAVGKDDDDLRDAELEVRDLLVLAQMHQSQAVAALRAAAARR
jgi:hypothetical protein